MLMNFWNYSSFLFLKNIHKEWNIESYRGLLIKFDDSIQLQTIKHNISKWASVKLTWCFCRNYQKQILQLRSIQKSVYFNWNQHIFSKDLFFIRFASKKKRRENKLQRKGLFKRRYIFSHVMISQKMSNRGEN